MKSQRVDIAYAALITVLLLAAIILVYACGRTEAHEVGCNGAPVPSGIKTSESEI